MERDALSGPANGARAAPPVLVLEDVDAAPPGSAHPVIRGVSLELRRGEMAVLLGGSGTGKSTLLRTAGGLWPARAGRVRAPGSGSFDPQKVGIVLEDPDAQFVGGTVAGELEFVLEGQGLSGDALAERRDRTLAEVGILHHASRDPRTLSAGEKQRALLAAALVLEPDLLLLDDPFLHLGPAAAAELWALLRGCLDASRVGAVLLAGAAADLAPDADRVGLLAGGRLVAYGPPDHVLSGAWPEAVEEPTGVWLVRRLGEEGWVLPAGAWSLEAVAARVSRMVRP